MITWIEVIQRSQAFNIGQAILLVVIGYFLARFTAKSTKKLVGKNISIHQGMLLRRFIFYTIFLIFVASAIQHVGFQIGTLLGAAGILTAAIGFASQTSMSNVISGLFIIAEKPFQVGDTVKINEVQGIISAIDLLSVKIRTQENTMVRVPNETLIRTPIINLSFFSTRRLDITIAIAYSQNVDDVKRILLEVSSKNALCLKHPAPTIAVQNFSHSTLELQLSIWANRDDCSDLKHTIQEEIAIALIKHGIQLPLPSYRFYSGNQAEPFSVKIVQG